MTIRNPMSWGAAIGAGIFASIALLPQARGELVYESDLQQQPAAQAARVEDRATLRQALGASEKAQVTIQAQQAPAVPVTAPIAAPAPAQVTTTTTVASAPVVAPALAQAASNGDSEVQNLSKTELMRRERMREEMKNEDILQERLEELRLRDERRRTEQLLTNSQGVDAQAPAPAAAGGVSTEVVAAPVTDHPGQPAQAAPAPVLVAPVAAPVAVQQDQLATSRASATAAFDAPSEKTTISITPRAGLANMSGGGNYDIKPHYAAGIGAGIGVSDNVSFELGYQYSEYGIALNSTNPFVVNYQMVAAANGYAGQFESVALKQNVVDAGLKLYFLGPDAKLRPFIGGGAAYGKSFVNYDGRILSQINQSGYSYLGQDYELTSYLGFLSTGLDVRVNKSISVGAMFKYYAVLSSRQNANLNNMALYGYYPNGLVGPTAYGAYPAGYAPSDADKQAVGGSLASSSFYSITGGVTFSF